MADITEIDKAAKSHIEREVLDHWNNDKTAYLLSDLGLTLKHAVPDSSLLFPKGIKSYLRENPIVQVVAHPEIEQKIGLVPLSVRLPKELKTLFKDKTVVNSEEQRAVYTQPFWNAFIRSLDEPRFVTIDDGVVEIVSGRQSAVGATTYEISNEDIVDVSAESPIADKVAATHAKIDAWLSRNRLDRSVFLKHRTSGINREPNVDGILALRNLFGNLSQEDQARISIPLDILLKITVSI